MRAERARDACRIVMPIQHLDCPGVEGAEVATTDTEPGRTSATQDLRCRSALERTQVSDPTMTQLRLRRLLRRKGPLILSWSHTKDVDYVGLSLR